MKPGIFEVLPNENLAQLFDFAQGFTSKAYTASVIIQQYTDREKKIQDIRKEFLQLIFQIVAMKLL
jgi:protein involved in polysaccharide export with SLBB domain